MKQLNLGFSLGFLAGTAGYDGVLESMVKHGANNFRVYEIFAKGFDKDIVKIVDRIQYLIRNKTANVMISISNIPYSWLSDYSEEEINALTTTQKSRLSHTNRFFPKPHRIEEYEALLLELQAEIMSRGLINNITWEVGNEPDAGNYFWGNYADSTELLKIRFNALKPSNRPINLADYTSSLMRDNTYKNKQQWTAFILTDPLYKEPLARFSHSFYWNDSGGTFNVDSNSYPNISLPTTISEYNMYTSFKPGSPAETDFNSRRYVNKFCEFLDFIYTKPIDSVYIHPLCEYPNDDTGKMAIYKKNYDPSTRTNYYILKPAGQYVYMLLDTIRYGYTPIKGIVNGKQQLTSIKGRDKSIVFDNLNNWNLVIN